MNEEKEKIAYLKDKLQGWPDAMCLTSKDVADLIALLNGKAGEQQPNMRIDATVAWEEAPQSRVTSTSPGPSFIEGYPESVKRALHPPPVLSPRQRTRHVDAPLVLWLTS